MTHDSLDHVGGAIDILDRMPVGVVMHPPDPVDGWEPACVAVIAEAGARRVPIRVIRAGTRFSLGAWTVRVLSPSGARPVGADPNPYSLVAIASAGSLDVLLTADAESDALRPLVTGSVEVLKVSHHGSEDTGLPRGADAPAAACGADLGGGGQPLPAPAARRRSRPWRPGACRRGSPTWRATSA